MYTGKLIFAQVMECVPHWEFQRVAHRYQLDSKRFKFSAWDHFLTMAFAQLTFRESLRDIESCLSASPNIGYHLGLRSKVSRSTLADANEQRDWRLFADLAQWLMGRARLMYSNEPNGLEMDATVYALDASLIDLSVALCPWANWTGTDAAVKLHTLLDLRGPLPAFLAITSGGQNERLILDQLPVEPGSYYIMDRGYVDFPRLKRLSEAGAYFVIREQPGVRFYVAESRPVDRSATLRCDQVIKYNGYYSRHTWPERMRRVGIFDQAHQRRMAFWTNQWSLSAQLIAEMYRQRWQVEIFFRWIKQNLRIRSLYGTTPNAIRVQLWISICTYLCVAIVRKQLRLCESLTRILQILSLHAFHKVPIQELLTNLATENKPLDKNNQLELNYL